MADDPNFPLIDFDPLGARAQVVAPVAALCVAHPLSRVPGECVQSLARAACSRFAAFRCARPPRATPRPALAGSR